MDDNTTPTETIGRRGYLGGLSSLAAATAFSLTIPTAQAAQITDGHDDPVQTVSSPDGAIEVTVDVSDGTPTYSVTREGATVLEESGTGFGFDGQADFGDGVEVTGSERSTVDETWTPIWDQYDEIRDAHEEVRIGLAETGDPGRSLTLVVRAFDDGVALRYVFPEDSGFGGFTITDERTEFAVPGDPTAWFIQHDFNSYEYPYNENALSNLGSASSTGGAHTPITMRTDDGLYLSIHEAELIDYASAGVVPIEEGSTTLQTDLAPVPDGTKVTAEAPHRTPWRTVQISDRPGGLIESNLIVNCNEPRDPEDFPQGTDWIEPSKFVGIWWLMITGRATWQYFGPDSGNHGAQTRRMKQYMDFASEHGIDSVLVEGWNVGWESYPGSGDAMDFDQPYEDFDLQAVTDYGATLDPPVEMTSHNETSGNIDNYESQLTGDDVFGTYDELGIHSIKTGYVADSGVTVDDQTHNHHCQPLVNHHHLVYREAAANRQMLEIHEPVKPTGERRRFPNVMTKEGVYGQEYDSFGDVPQAHHVTFPFTRMVAGPVEYTPGVFDMESRQGGTGIQTTWAKQLAMYPTYFSGLHMVADVVSQYLDDGDDSVSVGGVVQAEFGDRSGGITTGSRWAGAQAAGYTVLDPLDTDDGASITVTASEVPSGGEYDVHLRYSSETEGEKTLTVESANGSTTVTLPSTGRWDTWESASATVSLPGGESDLSVVKTASDSTNVYVDAVAITETGESMPEPDEPPVTGPTVDAFQFVKDVPACGWDDTRVVDAEIGEYMLTARQKDGEWYLGAMTNGSGRAVEVPLDFLDGEYVAEMYVDGADVRFPERKRDVSVREAVVDDDTIMTASMAQSGGMAVRFRPAEGDTGSIPDYSGPNQSISASLPSRIAPETPFVTVSGSNDGGAFGGTNVEVAVDGSVDGTFPVRVPPETSDFETTLPTTMVVSGDHDIEVRTVEGGTLASGTVTVSESATTPGPTTDTSSGFGPGFGAASALVGVAASGAYALKRRLDEE